MGTPLICLLILLLTSPLYAGRSDIEPDQPRATVTEANHFYSETETSARYKLANLQKDRPLVFHLKPQVADSTDNGLEANPVTITLETDAKTSTCVFTRYTNLCALDEVASEVKLTIECKSTPCSLNWLIVQPAVHNEDGKQAIDQLVAVNKKSKHAIVRVICSNSDLKNSFGDDIHLYSNSKFRKLAPKMGIVYFLFSNEEKGHYYVTASNEAARSCANVTLKHPLDTIDLEAQKNSIMDFVSPLEVNVYDFVSLPTSDFRIEVAAHDLMLEPLDNNTGIQMFLLGFKVGVEKPDIISRINLMVDNEKSHFEFSFAFKKPTQKYDKIKLGLRSQDRALMMNMRFVAGDVQEVELGQESYFDLKQGEKIKYKLVPVKKDVKGLRKMYIFGSDDESFKVSKKICEIRGCEFEVEALKKGVGSIYIGQDQNRNVNEIIVTEFNESVTQKVKEGQKLYFSFKTNGKSLQLLINSPSVIAYAADRQKCADLNDDKCYEKTFNSHNPGIYHSKVDGEVLIRVFALDNCEFTLTVLSSAHIFQQIKDSVPFTYLMDDKQKSIFFYINLPKAEDISFNLIGPANELILRVLNKEKPKEEDINIAHISSDGYIRIPKEEFSGLRFIVMVEKRQEFLQKFVHFTIIASTQAGNLRLEPGIAHYQTLHSKDRRDYVFEFQPQNTILLNFYSHNLKSLVDLSVKISNADEFNNRDATVQLAVEQEVDVLDIAQIAKKLCRNVQGENCELFVRVENKMDLQVDVTITLMMHQSIIELKDGLWQSYKASYASANSHFFFLPKHFDHSTTIFYKSTLVDLRIMYTLWRSDDQSIDPTYWPFPGTQIKRGSEVTYKPIDFIHIEPKELKDCWPNCIVLLSIVPDVHSFKSELKKLPIEELQKADFRIMATNNYVELPEKHKVDIIMVKDEMKELLVNMKYFMEVDELTFEIHKTVGYQNIHVSVSSEKNRRCPSADKTGDFVFNKMQTSFSIPIEEIKKKITENDMDGHRNINLCLLVEAITDTKFSIEFTSDSTAMKTLTLDSTYSLHTKENQINYYRIDASQEFQLKVTRIEGFPYISTKTCPGGNSQPDCVDGFQSDSTRGKKQSDKVNTLTTTPCAGCLLLVRVETETVSKLTLHPQSKFTEIELREGIQMSEDLDRSGQHRYTVTGSRQKDLLINIQVTSGNLRVRATDFGAIDLTETNSPGSKNIHITIPAKHLTKNETKSNEPRSDSFGLSSFVNLHLTVQTQNHQEKASYIISYSNGNATLSLQDGVITEYKLLKKGQSTFIYENPKDTGIYLHISTPDVQSLTNLKVKMYGAEDINKGMVEFVPEKPSFKQKTPNPTMLLQLPAKKFYYSLITNENDKDVLLSIGVNNLEIIYLPFEHEFPIQLERTEVVHIVLRTSQPGYVRVSFSKCDQSQPYIGYTTEYEDFLKEEFSVEQQMGDELTEDLFIRTKIAGGVYIKLRSPANDQSLLIIKATFSKNKFSISKSKAGEQGMIQYQRIDSNKAELSLASLVCSAEDKNCSRDFSYSAISSHSMDSVYAQLVCPSVMFDLVRVQHLLSSDSIPISSSSIRNGRVTFTHQISGDVSYIGVKAVNSRTGEIVYYRPIEISTLWGEMNRNSKLTVVLRLLGIVLVIGGLIFGWKKWRGQKQYKEVGFFNESYE